MIVDFVVTACDTIADGNSFGDTGPYQRVLATARGEVDPDAPQNRGIVGLQQAPRNNHGLIEYDSDVCILRPIEPQRGNGIMLYEVNNRGRKMLFPNLADATVMTNQPMAPGDFGNGFPLRRGYTIVWSGWDADAPRHNGGLSMSAPPLLHQGMPEVRRIRDEFVSGTRLGELERFRLSHVAASRDPAEFRVTVRAHRQDPPQVLASDAWQLLDDRTLCLLPAGTKPRPGFIYEVFYPASGAKVLGLGLAATRDIVAWLRHDDTALSILGRRLDHALALGISQAGRYLRDHIALGFNRGEAGEPIFDGVLAHIAGAGRVFLNQPFAQPFRTVTQHEDRDYPESVFPFSPAWQHDPLSDRTGALMADRASDPLLMLTNSSSEYWQKGASLLHTDPLGQADIALPDTARVYLIAGTQHAGRASATSDFGPNLHRRNPHNPMPALRALLVALERWVVEGRAPPPSRVPRIDDGTLVPWQKCHFPEIPGAGRLPAVNPISQPGDWIDPQPQTRTYGCLVPQVDADGNELAGIRLPDIAVPRGTHTGWNLYKPPYPENEMADRDGSFLPFAKDRAEARISDDPRRSLAQRYPTPQAYITAIDTAVEQLLGEGLLLAEDAEAYRARARARQ